MDIYPFNLVLAVAVASATIFLGFLPLKNIRTSFFAQETIKAAFAWLIVAMASPQAIMHYHFMIAAICFGSWWQLRRDKSLSGKMWLSVGAGLGISIGVMLLLASLPRAYPPDLPQPLQGLLLASIYLGGAVIGLAYMCYVLNQNLTNQSGVTIALGQRFVGLLVVLVVVRAAVMVGLYFESGFRIHPQMRFFGLIGGNSFIANKEGAALGLVFLVAAVLPGLAVLAQRATAEVGSRFKAAHLLIGICLLGLLAEILARLLLL